METMVDRLDVAISRPRLYDDAALDRKRFGRHQLQSSAAAGKFIAPTIAGTNVVDLGEAMAAYETFVADEAATYNYIN